MGIVVNTYNVEGKINSLRNDWWRCCRNECSHGNCKNDKNAKVTTLEKGHIYSYGQCGLPYVIGGHILSSTDVIARSVESFRSKYGIDAKTGYEVLKVDPTKKTVVRKILQTRDTFNIKYDR